MCAYIFFFPFWHCGFLDGCAAEENSRTVGRVEHRGWASGDGWSGVITREAYSLGRTVEYSLTFLTIARADRLCLS